MRAPRQTAQKADRQKNSHHLGDKAEYDADGKRDDKDGKKLEDADQPVGDHSDLVLVFAKLLPDRCGNCLC